MAEIIDHETREYGRVSGAGEYVEKTQSSVSKVKDHMVTSLHQMVYRILLGPSGALKKQYIQLGLALVDDPNESREIKEADWH